MRARWLPGLAVTVVLTALMVSCRPKYETVPLASALGRTATAASEMVQGEILVYVPCGVAGPYGEIKALFEKAYPGVTVTQEVANIDVQTELICNGKGTPDAWISLGDREVLRVAEAGRLDGEPVTFAYNSVAFIVAKGNPCAIEQVEDLASSAVRTIAIPTERNSSGYYTKAALVDAGLWAGLEPKLWLTDHPSEVKDQVVQGKADVGVVYYPCTQETRQVGGKPQEMPGKAQMLGALTIGDTSRIPAQAAVIKGCKNPASGRAFIEFMLTDAAQEIWDNWRFDRVTPRAASAGENVTLHLYSASGIRPFTEPAAEAFRELRPNVRIDVAYAGSGCLLSQLTFAERGDLYMPGEEFYMAQARERGFITQEALVGYFEPVIIVPECNPKAVAGLEDLARPGLKVGLGEPEITAVGHAAEELLENAGILDAVLKNVVMHAGNVPELANAVQLGSLDAAIVWNVTAAQVTDSCDVIEIPEEYWEPSEIRLGVLSFSKHPEIAQAFLSYCTSPTGQDLVAKAGMTPAPAPEEQ